MKKFNLINLIFLAMLVTFSFSGARAQSETQPAAAAPDAANQKNTNNRRPNLLAALGLNQDQIAQIRLINANKRPLMRAAQQRLREANRSLDQAIYADNIDESEIQARLKEVQTAQAEVVKIRSLTELAVRRILTAEQLARFRELRRQFIENTEKQPNQTVNRPPKNAPNRRLNNRPQQQASPNI